MRILLADDHALVRQGLRKVLEERPEWEVVAEAGNGLAAVSEAVRLTPDIAIVDVEMPLLNGIEATREIARRVPTTRLLAISMHADEAYVSQTIRAGALGYVLKDSADVDLVHAVEAVSEGKSFFSPAIVHIIADGSLRGDTNADRRYALLSERERQILRLVAEATTNQAIGALLKISASSVEAHVADIMEKLDLHSAAEIVLYAVRRGVVR